MRSRVPGWVLILAVACGRAAPVASPESTPAGEVESSTGLALSKARALAGQLAGAGLLTEDEARGLVMLGADRDVWGVYVTPGAPGASEAVKVVVLAPEHLVEMPSAAGVRFSTDTWAHQLEVPGAVFASKSMRGYVFSLGARGAPGAIEFAVQLQYSGAAIWLNHEGANYHLEVLGQRVLEYVGGLTAQQGGMVRSLSADPLFAEHDVELSVETYPPSSDVHPVLHWLGRVGKGSAPMALVALAAGPYAQNTQWTASVPQSALGIGAPLRFWVEVKGPINTLWDSRDGENYRMAVASAPSVEWAELGIYGFTKCHFSGGSCQVGWFYGSGMNEPFSATPSDYQVYASAPSMSVEAFVAGVTDVGAIAPQSAPTFIRAEVFSPFFSGAPSGTWSGYPLHFSEKAGNNWRLRWDVRSFTIPYSPPIGVACALNGDYPFKIRLSTDSGKTWQWLGKEGLPLGGENRTLHWENQSSPPALSVSGTTKLPLTDINHASTAKIELVNTTHQAVVITGVSVVGAGFSASISGCASAATCNKMLQTDERLPISVRFAPLVAGPAQGQLQVFEHAEGDPCYQAGRFDVGLTGTGR